MSVRPTGQAISAGLALFACATLSGCDALKRKSPAATKAQSKREQAACASPAAYDRLKNSIFDAAIAERPVDQPNLDVLADYSVARMENPVVQSWDQSLDSTRCRGRFVLEVPPGAERGLGGARQLQADIEYTAQASADGSGLVYRQKGADAIIAKLASFNLGPHAYRPPPAIDEDQPQQQPSQQVPVRETQSAPLPLPVPAEPPRKFPGPSGPGVPDRNAPDRRQAAPPLPSAPPHPPRPVASEGRSTGETAVRAFYGALGAGNGAAASSHVIPEKRSGGPFSAGAISRFYGRLPEPLHLTSVTPVGGAYRVTYRYSAGRSHCNGVAIVRTTNRGGRDLIASIRSLTGC